MESERKWGRVMGVGVCLTLSVPSLHYRGIDGAGQPGDSPESCTSPETTSSEK